MSIEEKVDRQVRSTAAKMANRKGTRWIVLRWALLMVATLIGAGFLGYTIGTAQAKEVELWRGLVVAPENRCGEYERRHYSYPKAIEHAIVRVQGGRIWSPYTNESFHSIHETDIEHIVATSEAHDSGMCARPRAIRREFAMDLRNLTLASPALNRWEKSGKDAAEWLPKQNRCWFAAKVVEVKRTWGLTVDYAEAMALEGVFSVCSGFAATPLPKSTLERYDDNSNGRITCAEARRHDIAPVRRGHPAYPYMRDGDGDGIVCE